jgi:hypothetical protein
MQGACISTAGVAGLGYSRSMQHIITSSTAAKVRMRVDPARRAHDKSELNDAGEDALGSFKGIAAGVLLGVALWVLLLGLYFLI